MRECEQVIADDTPTALVETELGDGLLCWSLPDLAKPRDLAPLEKLALEVTDAARREQAQSRQEICWWCGKLRATRWVHHVGFDHKDANAELGQHTQFSSDDYPGPVPGFCSVCYDGPRNLAVAVYFDHPTIQMGARARRWYVQMTDGSREAGEISEHPKAPIVSLDTNPLI